MSYLSVNQHAVTATKEEPDDDEFSDEDEDSFHISGELAPPRRHLLTTKELHDLIHDGAIDLNPPYQRDVVWPQAKQALLIDSIFRNISIPSIVFAVVKDEEGELIRVCVDGKQRLTSIQRFLCGQLPYKMSRNKHYYFTSPSAKQRLLIPDAFKERFLAKLIPCEEHTDLTPALEREIFQRVQLGMPLTAAEKLAAISSARSDLISMLEAQYVSSENGAGLADLLDWDTKRGRQFQNVAQLVYCAALYPVEEVPTGPKLANWLNHDDVPGEQFTQAMKKVFDDYSRIAEEPHLKSVAFGKQRIAPIEFVFIGVLLYVIRQSSEKEKTQCIHHLRKTIRKSFTDVRANKAVGVALWGIIDKLKHDPLTSATSHVTPSRRKRGEEEDGDYRPGATGSGSKRRRA
ncbi:hypothetical protein C8F01DRAFT_1117794 [Mycena amicta]|nr:hypothetical protein C8F01DRAFT_1117794 [Mycena amicta]